ncbi:unnamed protein product [Sphagnum jensenii]
MIDSAFVEATAALQDSNGVLRSYATYASGVENLQARVKQAEEDAKSEDEEMKADDGMGSSEEEMDAKDDFLPSFEDEESMPDTLDMHNDHDDKLLDEELDYDPYGEDGEPPTLRNPLHEGGDDLMEADDMNTNKLEVTLPPGSTVPAPGQPVPAGTMAAEKMANLTTKEGRQAYRLKLAEDLGASEDVSKLKYSPVLDEAHKGLIDQDFVSDLPDSEHLSRFETKEEVQKRVLEVAKMPVKVRKEAERLNKMISEGSVKKSDLDQLVAEGLDADVVKYWRELYDVDPESKEFAKLLTTAAEEEKAKEEMQNYKLKLARSYALANDMAKAGLISDNSAAITRQVDEAMGWNDEAFDSFKRVVAKRSANQVVKTAGVIPQVGINGSGEMVSTASEDLLAELDQAFAGRKY